MRKEKPIPQCLTAVQSLYLSIQCLLSPNPKQIPAEILSTVPAFAPAPMWYVLATKHFSHKMEKADALKVWNKLAAHI